MGKSIFQREMVKDYYIIKPNPNVIVIKINLIGQWIFFLIGLFVLSSVFLSGILAMCSWSEFEFDKLTEMQEGTLLAFLVVSFLLIPPLIYGLIYLIKGKKFSFNSVTKKIEKNGREIAKFNEIDVLKIQQLVQSYEPETDVVYNLYLVLKNEPNGTAKEIYLWSGTFEFLYKMAKEVSEIIDVDIIKVTLPFWNFLRQKGYKTEKLSKS